ncbi:xylulokinase [Streptococcus caprae]|uniref:Xylulokinase n=1 Tax=Streptococcus caprae TaxID=1640501 RepID=A0ABV8CUQ6_9STRE
MATQKESILSGQTSLGIEFGSTRIKAVLLDSNRQELASSSYQWENQLVDGLWTYSQEVILDGLQTTYGRLKEIVLQEYGVSLTKIGQVGISAMMHGYLAFDEAGQLLVPFRTWRNSNTGSAAKALTEAFNFNIPERWSVAHLYQAILNKEEHVPRVHHITTLAGYIHWLLTGRQVLGVGDASGLFPIDSLTKDYHKNFLARFSELIAEQGLDLRVPDIFPQVLVAGAEAGQLTPEGASLLDPTGQLEPGACFCPPEGDAGTGMVATNSVRPKTGNVSAGTSVFAMVVLEEALKRVHPEIDLVTTPSGDAVAMVHANNCTSDLNAWVNLFHEFAQKSGSPISLDETYQLLFESALKADSDTGQLVSYGLFSGENILGLDQGRPILLREANSQFNLANLMKSHILSAFSTLAIGMEILTQEEQVPIDSLLGHGGIFATPRVAQECLSAILDLPISVTETANTGGAWGMAILADYLNHTDKNLEDYLENTVFYETASSSIEASTGAVQAAQTYLERFKSNLEVERSAIVKK